MPASPASNAKDARVRRFLLLGWGVLLLGAVGYWYGFSRDAPHGDVWNAVVPIMVDAQPVTLEWFLSYHNVHVVVVPRILFVLSGWFADFDFRAVALVDVFALGAAAWVLLLAARKLRGEARFTDLCIALALLHPGHATNFLGALRSQYVISVALASALLFLIVSARGGLTRRGLFGVAVCLLGLAGCGLNGLVFVPMLALWPALAGKLEGRKWSELGCELGLLLVAGGFTGAYFLGLPELSTQGDESREVGATAMRAIRFLGSTLGVMGRNANPWAGVGVLGIVLLSAIPPVRLLRQREDRSVAVGLLLFASALLMLTLAVGWGRTRNSPDAPRYVTLLAPLLCWAYFCWVVPGRERASRFAQAFLLLLALAIAVFDGKDGIQRGQAYARELDALVADSRAGTPPRALASLHVSQRAIGFAENWMSELRSRGLGPFRNMDEGVKKFDPLDGLEGKPLEFVRLERGSSLRQRFPAGEFGSLVAVHVLFEGRAAPRPAEVHLRLEEITASGERTGRGAGVIHVSARDYYTLQTEPTRVHGDTQLELTIWIPEELSRRVNVFVPFRKLDGSRPGLHLFSAGDTYHHRGGEPVSLVEDPEASLDFFLEFDPVSR